MRDMINKGLISDYKTEQIFSIVRWIFLVVAVIMFYYPPIETIVKFNGYTFNYLLIFGFIYMTIAQISLSLASEDRVIFNILIKAGILFDYIALIWLLVLSGGVTSPLFPISYLLVMHATIYWRIKGAIVSCSIMLLSYLILFLVSLPGPSFSTVIFVLNVTFLLVIGFFGALIVNRERYHQKLQGEYKDVMIRDYLTGLYNHRHFQETLKVLLTSKNQSEITVLLGDIDNFKRINDEYGHVVGDQVLMKIGEVLQSSIPKSVGSSFRYGGEEFAILFHTANRDQIVHLIKNVYTKLQDATFTSDSGPFSVTMSFGLYSQSKVKNNHVDLVRKADDLLYTAKKQGKNQAIFDCGTIIKGTLSTKEVS